MRRSRIGSSPLRLRHCNILTSQLNRSSRQSRHSASAALALPAASPARISPTRIFHPFWSKCEELGVLVFMHPLGTSELEPSGRLAGNGLLTNTIGNPLETTIALSHLIFEGTLDRFPGLKICASHGGGFLPSYANRSDAVITTFPDRVGPYPKKKPTEYIRGGQLYFDSIMFTGEGMRHLIAEAGIDHVVLGTDYPFPWNTAPVDHIMAIPGLSDEDRIKILGGTAAKLLGIEE